jgi:hypothetical protein
MSVRRPKPLQIRENIRYKRSAVNGEKKIVDHNLSGTLKNQRPQQPSIGGTASLAFATPPLRCRHQSSICVTACRHQRTWNGSGAAWNGDRALGTGSRPRQRAIVDQSYRHGGRVP